MCASLCDVVLQQVQPDDVDGLAGGGLTLTRLRVWSMEPMKRLTVLAWLVSECQGTASVLSVQYCILSKIKTTEMS